MKAAWPSRVRGVALVIVLWLLMLLTVIANGVAMTARTEAQVAGNMAALAQAEAAADAAIHQAIVALLAPVTEPGQWQSNGVEHQWAFGDASVRVTIRDEAAKVDLNVAPAVLLAGLFRAVGVPAANAEALADAVIDWRDPDDLRSLHGAERANYAEAGKAHGPANANFDSVEELRQVLGVTPEIFHAVRRFVTVHSQSASVNAGMAERAVLMALPGATSSQVDAYLEQRRSVLALGLPPPPFTLAPSSGGTSYRSVQAQAELSDNVHFGREAVVWLTGNPTKPFVILAWRALGPGNEQFIDTAHTP